jgi:acetyl-CoA acetyltransferase
MIGDLASMAAVDAWLAPDEIDGLLVGSMVGTSPQHTPATVAEYLGIHPRYADVVDLGGATAAGMVWRAGAAIAAGMCDAVLCVLASARERGKQSHWTNRTPIREFDVPYGASGANANYALIAQRHMAEFGTTSEQLAKVAVDMRINAEHNPNAIFQGALLTIDDVLSSPMVASPLHLLDIVMPCSGGAAVIVAAPHRRNVRPTPVWVRGAGERVTHRALSQAPSLTESPMADAIDRAYRMAGIASTDLDLLSPYDCYTIMVAITLEDAQLCPKGASGRYIDEHDLTFRGELPVNPHGGQLACGQADLAGGMSHIVEAVRQLRGQAGPRQVPNPELVLVTGNGAVMGEGTALVLGVHS